MIRRSNTMFDVQLKITMSDENSDSGDVNIYGYHSGTNLRKTIESTVASTIDMMDEMFGNQMPSPWRDPEVRTSTEPVQPLSPIALEVLLIRSDLEDELLADNVYFHDGS